MHSMKLDTSVTSYCSNRNKPLKDDLSCNNAISFLKKLPAVSPAQPSLQSPSSSCRPFSILMHLDILHYDAISSPVLPGRPSPKLDCHLILIKPLCSQMPFQHIIHIHHCTDDHTHLSDEPLAVVDGKESLVHDYVGLTSWQAPCTD